MDQKPLVSVVMPIYGVEKYIEDSVRSVIAQTYDNIELILVDDGSLDRSVETAERVLRENDYPYILIHQKNAGLGFARNTGLQHANGEWIIFFDSDDVIHYDMVERFVEASGSSEIDLVFSGFSCIYDYSDIKTEKNCIAIQYSPRDLQYDFLLRKRLILASGTMMRRSVLADNGLLFSKIPWSEDQHFMWRLLSVIRGAVFIDGALYQYLQHTGSIMSASKIEKMIVSYPAICELPKYYLDNETVYRFLVPRWVMGTLNAAARITGYKGWIQLYKHIDGELNMKALLAFPSIRGKCMSLLFLLSKRLYYLVIRKV